MSPLIDEMRVQIHATPLPDGRRARRRRRLGVVSGVAAGLAAAVAVSVLVLGGGPGAAPAYATAFHTVHGRRTVTITLREERDLPRLDALLAAEHTRIRVVPVVRGCDAPVHPVSNGRVVPGPARTLLAVPTVQDGGLLRIVAQTIAVDTIAGRTLVIPYGDRGGYSFGGGVVVGGAPRCVGLGPRDVITTSR